MNNEIRTGLVKTLAIDAKSLMEGTMCILDNSEMYGLCTLQHLDTNGEWVIEYKTESLTIIGQIPPGATLCSLQVEDTNTDDKYPLKFNQWQAAIRSGEINSTFVVKFEVLPIKFIDGNYHQTCSLCNSSFLAHKRQPLCMDCCIQHSIAKIMVNDKPKAVKKPKPKMYPESVVLSAFVAGSIGTNDWENWSKQNL